MEKEFDRTVLLLGEEALSHLRGKHICLFGVGGVGSYALETLARVGIGSFTLYDGDTVSVTNINRQLLALNSTVGRKKVEVARERVADICPETKVEIHPVYCMPDSVSSIDFRAFDYVVDAIDMIPAKVAIIQAAKAAGTPIISSMGTGNKLDPMAFRVADIYKTRVCPLARVMRHELKKAGVTSLDVVYSEEEPRISPRFPDRCRVPASISFVPAAAGLLIAATVVENLLMPKM